MAEYPFTKTDLTLSIDGKYFNTLNIEGFSQMLKDPSYCYKFYWLEAIVQLISEGITETSFNAVIDEMICNAWYSVREYHIHLSGLQWDGNVRDGLERAVIQLAELSGLPSNASKVEIKNAIKEYDKELSKAKKQLTNMVPYRALAGFLPDKKMLDSGVRRLTAYIEYVNQNMILLPYKLGTKSQLKKEIYFQKDWIEMICDNMVAILGWIQYEKVKWLQNINPEVPGLVYKLVPADAKVRKLNQVKKLWEGILDLSEVRDVFTEQPIISKKYDIDHFIPWSFLMNDELWNLMPMDSSLNSSKSNRLPKWDPFFMRFAENQYLLYGLVHSNEQIRKRFDACYKDNLHSIWAGQELYRTGNTKEMFFEILQKNMQPVYDSARRQGYEMWNISFTE